MPKISQLPAASSVGAGDLFAIVQGATTKKATSSLVLSYVQTNVQITESQVTNLTADLASKLAIAANLSDVANVATARTNLGIGSSGTHPDSFFLQTANNLSDLQSVSTARTNLGLGTAAQQNVAFFLQTANNLSDVPNKPTALSNLGALPIAGGTMTGNLTLIGDPTTENMAANKHYVDITAQGLHIQGSCYGGTTANLAGYVYDNGTAGVGATLTAGGFGAFTVDGLSPPLGSRILVKNQATTYENGIYVLSTVGDGSTAAVLTRALDYDEPADIQPGDFVVTNNGTVNENLGWLQENVVVDIGVDPIVFAQFGGNFAQKGANADITSMSGLTGDISAPTSITMATGGAFRTGTTNTNTALLQAYNTGGASYTTFGTLTAGASPTFDLASSVTVNSLSLVNTVRKVVQQVFTANGTYTPTTGMIYCMIECIGPGGGGGGGAGVAATSSGAGGGGGGGQYSRSFKTAAQVGASQAVTVGTGGAGGAAGTNNGAAGSGNTSVGALVTAGPGAGGNGSVARTTSEFGGGGGSGGSGGTADFSIVGGVGALGFVISGSTGIAIPGKGGGTFFGMGGGIGTGASGSNGALYGAGGDGGYAAGADAAGNNGANGVVVITEFCNQ